MLCDFLALGFVHDESFKCVGSAGGYSVKLVFGLDHVAVEDPDDAAIPLGVVFLGLVSDISQSLELPYCERRQSCTYSVIAICESHNLVLELIHEKGDPPHVIRII